MIERNSFILTSHRKNRYIINDIYTAGIDKDAWIH
jgi:hypothetical protein